MKSFLSRMAAAALVLAALPSMAQQASDGIRPDVGGSLEVLSQSCRQGARLRCSARVQLDVLTTGSGVRNVLVRFYLSNDATLEPQRDALLREISSGPLRGAGQSRTLLLQLPLPLGVDGTGKYVIAVLDPYNRIDESDESNNVIVSSPIE